MYQFRPSSELNFQPSPYSESDDYGVVPLVVGAVAAVGSLAVGGIKGAMEKKAQKDADPAGTYMYYQQKYEDCKAKREGKGKKAYPEDSSTSIFSTNCHTDYNKMKDWEAKAEPYLMAMVAPEVVDKGKPGKPVGYTVPIVLGAGIVATLGLGYLLLIKRSGR